MKNTETQQPTPADRGTGLAAYMLMAFFVVMTACTGLYPNRRLMDIYNSSVSVNLSWTARLQQLGDLARMSLGVTATAIDIFDTQDSKAAVPRMTVAMDRMDARLAAARADLAAEVQRPGRIRALPGLLERLDKVIATQDDINTEVGELHPRRG